MTITSSLNIPRLRGLESARSAVERATPVGMTLFARSLAHEVVGHMIVEDLSDESCTEIASVWASAAKGQDRDQAISAVIDRIELLVGLDPATGLSQLGFSGWDSLVREALGLEEDVCHEGVDMLAELVASEAESLKSCRALEAVPERAMVEMSFIPGWDGKFQEEAVEGFGLRFDARVSSIGSVRCGPEFSNMLKFFNISVCELLLAVQQSRPDEYEAFADRLVQMPGWQSFYKVNPSRPRLMTAEQFLGVIENASPHAIPNLSFQVRLKSLLSCDPARPIRLDAEGFDYHVGCHDGLVNGAGYMDTFKASGPVSISLAEGSLISESGWRSSLSAVYWHVKSAYRVGLSQPTEGQMDVSRLLERVGG